MLQEGPMDQKKLSLEAETLAGEMRIRGTIPGKGIARRCRKVLREILAVDEKRLSPEAREWMLDNRYRIEDAGRRAIRDLAGIRRLSAAGKSSALLLGFRGLLGMLEGPLDPGTFEIWLDAFSSKVCLGAEDTDGTMPLLTLAVLEELREELSRPDCRAFRLAVLIPALKSAGEPVYLRAALRCDRLDRILSQDPTGEFGRMDRETRGIYREALARLARRRGISQSAAAEWAVREAGEQGKHVGEILLPPERARKWGRIRSGGYITLVLLLSFIISLYLGIRLDHASAALLLLLPVSECVKNGVDLVVLRLLRPHRPYRMDLEEGVPEEGKTLCVISALLTREEAGESFARLLEEYALCNRDAGKNLSFALLADLKEAGEQETPRDREILTKAAEAIEQLNRRYGGGFALLGRRRTWSKTMSRWMGRERKRGAIEELMKLLRGEESELRLSGDPEAIQGIRYVLALDGDTRLTPGSAKSLIAAALHPLNRPAWDSERGVVTRGYGILQPRIGTELESARKNGFTRLYAGRGGCDPYSGVASDLYQELSGRGSFNGKGLLHVDAYLACLRGRFPAERVLSHDLLEGAFLSCRYVSDTELLDGYPGDSESWYAREERWIRGDWQAAHWMRPFVHNEAGERVRNPLEDGDKWKLLDNLRRSLVQPFTFVSLAVGILFGDRGFWILALVAGVGAYSGSLLDLCRRTVYGVLHRESLGMESLTALLEAFLGMLVRLAFLPQGAFVASRAVLIACWRIFVSKRNLLQWVTAGEAEKGKKTGIVRKLRFFLPAWAMGLGLLIRTEGLWMALPALWILSPWIAWLLQKGCPKAVSFQKEDRGFLQRAAEEAYAYFVDVGAEDHFLPPDHFQEKPAAGTAHRTSPTNIGMALLSHLAALDLGLTHLSEARERIAKTMDTLERLERWHGHFYNWYDTQSLRVIGGGFVSTVDSGNLCASLLTLAEGLKELGEPSLAKRAEDLGRGADFRPLYDRDRCLFYTGWDTVKDRPAGSDYDLLISEARLTSFLAVALGQVPVRHWRSLGRIRVRGKRGTGLASWTGTAFEYFMPELLLRTPRGSLLDAALRFCLSEQRLNHSPWGESESSFFAFDRGLGYCYKAHGSAALALKRGMEKDTVIAPYASFLMLEWAGEEAVKNLHRLKDGGYTGKYGFFEAVDYTAARVGDRPEPVATFMAHHIGMSILAVENALCRGGMAKRFMAIPEMAAHRCLLAEKDPESAPVLRRRPREEGERPQRLETPDWSRIDSGIDFDNPRCVLLSNGAYSTLVTDGGVTLSRMAELELTRFLPGSLDGCGIAAALWGPETFLPLTPAAWNAPGDYAFLRRQGEAEIRGKTGSLSASMKLSVPGYEAGEKRVFRLEGQGEEHMELILFLRPVLAPIQDYEAHPAFSRLMLEYRRVKNGVLVRRRPGGGKPEHWLGILFSEPFSLCTSWEDGMGRALLPASELPEAPDRGPLPDGALIIRIRLEEKREIEREILMSMAYGAKGEDALVAARRIMEDKAGPNGEYSARLAARLGLGESGVFRAMELLGNMRFRPDGDAERQRLFEDASGEAKELWRFGVSGDLPILVHTVKSGMEAALREILDIHQFLAGLGENSDLVLLTEENGDYMGGDRPALYAILRSMDAMHRLGKRGGIHLVPEKEEHVGELLAASAVYIAPRKPERSSESRHLARNLARPWPSFSQGEGGSVWTRFDGMLPPRTYTQILAGKTFGMLTDEAGTGHLWLENAREVRLTPWRNDRQAASGPETISLIRQGKRISLFAADDGCPCRVEFGFGYARWQKQIGDVRTSVTAFVPLEEPYRAFLLRVEGAGEEDEIEYTALPAGGDRNEAPLGTRSSREDRTLSLDLGFARMTAASSRPFIAWTCDRAAWKRGDYNGFTGVGRKPILALRISAEGETALLTGCLSPTELKELAEPKEIGRGLEATKRTWQALCGGVRITTPDEALDHYLNGWAVYQSYAARMLARCGPDQCGGALGFRDQLQDCRALMLTRPDLAKDHLILAASRQYREGDVQHWWHPDREDGNGKGVRTRCSDDLLWLPFVLGEYVEKTGDRSILSVEVPYLISPPLAPEEKERYESPEISQERDSMLNHAFCALKRCRERGEGPHGLCLMGACDWNDGMDLNREEGEAESLWLSAFAVMSTEKLLPCLKDNEERLLREELRSWCEALKEAIRSAHEGDRYPRAFLADGTILGRKESPECAMDSISQSFAWFAGIREEKTVAALNAAAGELQQDGVCCLFTPPFDGEIGDPGYICRYAPGFRENGGQYTHAAVWLAAALLQCGETDRGKDLLLSLLPEKKEPAAYRGEPYVLPGDVSSAPGFSGRVGWTWYTGSAAWYDTTALEDLCGLRLRDGKLCFRPNLPSDWSGLRVQVGKRLFEATRRGERVDLTLDGVPYNGEPIDWDYMGNLR